MSTHIICGYKFKDGESYMIGSYEVVCTAGNLYRKGKIDFIINLTDPDEEVYHMTRLTPVWTPKDGEVLMLLQDNGLPNDPIIFDSSKKVHRRWLKHGSLRPLTSEEKGG